MQVGHYRKVVVVGDIHGCLEELELLIDKIGFDKNLDLLVSCGDVVDRGPNSAEAVRYLIHLNARSVLGNHDAKLLRYHKHLVRKQQNKNYRFPMAFDEDRSSTLSRLSEDEIEWIKALPSYIFLEEYNTAIVHAGVLPNIPLDKQTIEVLTMVRYIDPESLKMRSLNKDYSRPEGTVYWTSVYNDTYNIVYGHCVHDLKEPNVAQTPKGAFCYGIDTGACFGGKLTAAVFSGLNKDPEIVQVDSLRGYSPFKKIHSF